MPPSSAISDIDVALSRRQVLRLGLGAATALLAPRAAFGSVPFPHSTEEFLDSGEFRLLDAITSRILPTDSLPGAREAGVVHYIQGLLSALPGADANGDRRGTAADLVALAQQVGAPAAAEVDAADLDGDGSITAADLAAVPTSLFQARPIFAGGPFSGRQPFANFETGQVQAARPGNSFSTTIPLTRLQRIAWQVRLDGAAGVPEVADNPLATLLPEVDLRRKYRDGLAAVAAASQAGFGLAFIALTPAQQDQVLQRGDASFLEQVTRHTVEGLLSAPEYGGNQGRVGWQLIGFDGDSQPLGYTLGFDERTQRYFERPDKPNSGPDPGETCVGFSPNMIRFLSVVVSNEITAPGARFRSPFCFGVDE